MRLPKFRCKNKTGNWCFFTALHNGNVNEENFDLETLSEFTGLLDKQGVEIYDGDIVRKLSGDYKLGKVVFEFGMFCFESIGCGIYAGSNAFLHIHSLHYKEYNSNNNYELIGNIYENPELLESKC